jgi:hypothetical protein
MTISNATLHKLTTEEIGELGLCNHGIMLYKGNLKSRRNGWKTERPTEWQTNFIGTWQRVEFIRLPLNPLLGVDEFAMRIYDLRKDEYMTQLFPLAGLDFLKI